MNQNEIEMTLLKMGIPGSVKGFRYIVDAIMLLNQDNWKDREVDRFVSHCWKNE